MARTGLVGAGGTIVQTSDGGDTWHHARPRARRSSLYRRRSLIIAWWAVGTGGRMLRTVNGGRTWQEQASG